MSPVARPALVLLAAGLLSAAAATPPTKPQHTPKSSTSKTFTYRWVDANGELHFGDQVPPEYANQERSVLNGGGVEVKHLDAQKTPEQQAADARDHAEAMKQKQRDAYLLSTYQSVRDIESLRDARLEQLKNKRASAEQYVESLRGRLSSLEERALGCLPYTEHARRMPDDLAENLVRTVNEMRAQSSALAATTQVEESLRTEFEADIARYRELMATHSPHP